MTLSRRVLKRINSPSKSPKLANSSLRKRTLIKQLSQDAQFGGASKANLKVVVRVRPENQREIDHNARSIIDVVDDHMLVFDPVHSENDFFFQGVKQKFRDLNKKHNKSQKFMFEHVFGPESTNEEIFETTTKNIIENLLSGYNCSVFAYGATGAGKTFTMLGQPSCPGITFLTVMELYKKILETEETKSCEVGVSYLEIYNEMVRDLLAPGKPLNLHESGQHVQVTGLTLHKPKNADELLKMLAEGNTNRTQHPTDANAESSRSHAVFQVFVRQQDRTADVKSSVSISKLSMIDLAGSERGAVTGFRGARFREGANINRSLLALGNCINALADGKSHIPYRDSKLTRLLKDCLGGNCRSVMIAAISKASTSYEDTFNTLRYANRAKTIKTMARKNLVNVDQHISQYVKVVEDLRGELSMLKDKIKEYEERGVECNKDNNSHTEIAMYEETIQKLQKQVEEKEVRSQQLCLKEREVLEELHDLNCQLKGYQRELLQLETSEREFEYKIFAQYQYIVQMNIYAFASKKLEKGIAKCARSIETFKTRLQHITKRKDDLHGKLSQSKQSFTNICERLRQFGSDEELSDHTKNRLLQNDLELSLRDSHQINVYLQDMVKGLISDKTNTEKLTLFLLIAAKYFYVKLKSLNQCDSETNDFFSKIIGMLDSSRIEWADLKHTENSFGEEILSEYINNSPSLDVEKPSLDVEKLIDLPVFQSLSISPVVADIGKIYRQSILKRNKSTSTLVPTKVKFLDKNITPIKENLLDTKPPENELNNTFNAPTSSEIGDQTLTLVSHSQAPISNSLIPLLSTPNISLNVTNNFECSEMQMLSDVQFPNATFDNICFPPDEESTSNYKATSSECAPNYTSSECSLNYKVMSSECTPNFKVTSSECVVKYPEPLSSCTPDYPEKSDNTPNYKTTLPPTVLSAQKHPNESMNLTISQESSCLPTSKLNVDETSSPPKANVSFTLSEYEEIDVTEKELVDNEELNCEKAACNSTFSLANEEVNSTFNCENAGCNNTFSLENEEVNSTSSGESSTNTSSKDAFNHVLQLCSSNVEKNPTTGVMLPPRKISKLIVKKSVGFKTPSKCSFSKLPTIGSLSNQKSMKKFASVPSLPGVAAKNTSQSPYNSQIKGPGLKRTFSSVLLPKVAQTNKNQENIPPKISAFGSTYYPPADQLKTTGPIFGSKRTLDFASSSKTPEPNIGSHLSVLRTSSHVPRMTGDSSPLPTKP